MEFTREIYWNIGNGAETLIPMYGITVAALIVLVWGFIERGKVYRLGQPLNRIDNLGARIVALLRNVFLQTRIIVMRGPGTAHGLFFWGLFLLFIGTGLIAIQEYFTSPIFGIKFLESTFYQYFSLILDLAGFLAIVMLVGLFIRRYLIRPDGLETKKDDIIIHSLLFSILVTGFFIEGARIAVTELGTPIANWSPFGLYFAKTMHPLGEATLKSLHIGLWWLHMVLVACLFMLIPYTKLRHIFTASANYFFADLGLKGNLRTIDLSNEDTEVFGAALVSDMTWKDIFDTDACTQCKRCQDNCPTHATNKPLSPMKVINQIGSVAFNNPGGNLAETISKDALWACTTCRACEETCPVSIEHVSKIVDMRRNMVLMKGEFPSKEARAAVDCVEVNSNPLDVGYITRGDWAVAAGVKELSKDADVDVLYFVGCYASFDKRNISIANSFITLCQAAGIKVGILGKEEKCCGEPIRKLGNEYLYQSVATENIERIKHYDVKHIVTTCPHCFNTLSKDYRDMGLELSVDHYTIFLEKLLNEGRLKLSKSALLCTYHDSCYLGRYNDIYEQPRTLLEATGAKIVEMSKNRVEGFCCGGGGGQILSDDNIGERINNMRATMAYEKGVNTLVSNCPFCMTMFEDGIKGIQKEDSLVAKDIAEILAERIVL